MLVKNPTNKTQLTNCILEAWDNISQDYINNAIKSMSRRLEAVLENRGSKINY